MDIIFVASESTPFIKTGGLADIVQALGKNLAQNHHISVFLPLYRKIKYKWYDQLEHLGHFFTLHQYVGIEKLTDENVTYYFIDNELLFGREHPYGYADDGFRFGFFSRAVLDSIGFLNLSCDVLHLHDWHTGLIPFILKTYHMRDPRYQSIKTILTIHNLQFQGIFNLKLRYSLELLEHQDYVFDNCLNFLKAGIQCSHYITTVSPTYRNETFTAQFGCRLENILASRQEQYLGILNGIDYQLFNPMTDQTIHINYQPKLTKETLKAKLDNKKALLKELGLKHLNKKPLYVMITRITGQKGFDLLNTVLPSFLSEPINFVMLGSGEAYFSDFLHHLHRQYDNFFFYDGYNELLAQKLYASADFLVMPSAFEPCGLAQIIALRYGTIPIVHETGGLKDTIIPYNEYEKTGNGISFSGYYAENLAWALHYSQTLFKQQTHQQTLLTNAFSSDFSMETCTKKYLELYQLLID